MNTNQALGIFVAIFISILGWAGLQIVDHGERIIKTETNGVHIIRTLRKMDLKQDKMDRKLDRVLEK